MKKYLLSQEGNFYKANLHCHTTLSDGAMTPEQVKARYMEKGYSVIAFTDHDIFLTHPELCSEDFLALNGFEVEITEGGKPWPEAKTCHICFVALDENICQHPLWHRSKYLFGNSTIHRDEVRFDESLPDYERSYTPECASDMMRIGREKGFFVTYNHPRWSMEEYNDYIRYNNMDAMEIYNHGCYVEGYWDYNGVVYDELLRSGKRIFCIATDDNHTYKHTCGGYVMIKAKELSYSAIAKALKEGDFYSSTGPEITELYIEDNEVHVRFPAAAKAILSTGIRRQAMQTAPADSTEPWQEAVFPLNGNEKYFRITLLDDQGHTADTNAYFLDTL